MYFSTYLLPPQQRLFALAADVGSVALETLRLKISSFSRFKLLSDVPTTLCSSKSCSKPLCTDQEVVRYPGPETGRFEGAINVTLPDVLLK